MIIRTLLLVALALSISMALPVASRRVSAAPEPLLVIVGIAFPATDIAFSTVKDVFSGRVTNHAGRRLIPINHPLDSPLRLAFDKAVLGLDPAAVGRYWVDVRVRDEGKPPTTATSPELAVRIVAALANSIAYSTASRLNPKVKALTLDGKSAGQPGYALKP